MHYITKTILRKIKILLMYFFHILSTNIIHTKFITYFDLFNVNQLLFLIIINFQDYCHLFDLLFHYLHIHYFHLYQILH